MGLLESIKDDEEKLKKMNAVGGEADETEEEEESETPDTDKPEAPEKKEKPEEKPADKKPAAKTDGEEEPKDGEKPAAKENPNSAAAKARIERKRADDAKKAAEAAAAVKQPTTPEPKNETADDKTLTVEERIARMEARAAEAEAREANNKLYQDAINEFTEIEKDFQKETPDYEPASSHMLHAMYNGVRMAHPTVGEKAAVEFVRKQILSLAAKAAQEGLNPAQELYRMAHDVYGYQPKEEKPEPKKDPTARLKITEKNKARTASPLKDGGQNSASNLSLEEGSNMSLADFSKLSEKEMDELISQAAS